MPKLLQISIEVNSGSVGRIAEQVGELALSRGWESYITYARNHLPSKSTTIRIGTNIHIYWHGIMTRLFDRHCLHSTCATRKLVEQIKKIKPDIIQIHHIHGYFLDMKILFNYLATVNIPVVWVFHDCWSMTGHCAHFEYAQCDRWKKACHDCPQKKAYPKSMFLDRSYRNYMEKQRLFTSVKNMTIVPVSNWLGSIVKESFLKNYDVCVIHNGIDINRFSPIQSNIREKYGIADKKIVLGVASPWSRRKGVKDFFELSSYLSDDNYQIVLIGLSEHQLKQLPVKIIGLARTESVEDLVKWYSAADVFVNPTYEDTYPTTNLEAISCGTPVTTYKTGGSPEALTAEIGRVVSKGDIGGLAESIEELCSEDRVRMRNVCREYAVANFNNRKCFEQYIDLYETLLADARE